MFPSTRLQLHSPSLFICKSKIISKSKHINFYILVNMEFQDIVLVTGKSKMYLAFHTVCMHSSLFAKLTFFCLN